MAFYGESGCTAKLHDGRPCSHKAYFEGLVCGMHNKKNRGAKLPMNPDAAEVKAGGYKQHLETVEAQRRTDGKPGQLMLTRMQMRRSVPLVPGFLNVFPNYQHQNRKDGFGCAELSPKSLGPLDTGQPGLPICKNLENFHQANKVFPEEVEDGEVKKKEEEEAEEEEELEREELEGEAAVEEAKLKKKVCKMWLTQEESDEMEKEREVQEQAEKKAKAAAAGARNANKPKIKASFFATQTAMYNDATPHRHKTIRGVKPTSRPLFSVWVDKDGSLHRLSYFESRQLYCHFYERMVADLPSLAELKKKLADGYNLNICGYDAFPLADGQTLEQCYKDVSKPFGHERVLYALLIGERPWAKYKTFDF
jgi:hypothetical protein